MRHIPSLLTIYQNPCNLSWKKYIYLLILYNYMLYCAHLTFVLGRHWLHSTLKFRRFFSQVLPVYSTQVFWSKTKQLKCNLLQTYLKKKVVSEDLSDQETPRHSKHVMIASSWMYFKLQWVYLCIWRQSSLHHNYTELYLCAFCLAHITNRLQTQWHFVICRVTNLDHAEEDRSTKLVQSTGKGCTCGSQ